MTDDEIKAIRTIYDRGYTVTAANDIPQLLNEVTRLRRPAHGAAVTTINDHDERHERQREGVWRGRGEEVGVTSPFNFKIFDASVKSDDGVDWSKPSKAVVVVGEAGGCVLFSAGPHLDSLMNEAGLSDLADLGLDDAPDGISVWEGVVKGRRYETADGYEYESDTIGSFRAPTDEEWASIRRNECPWDVNDWKKT